MFVPLEKNLFLYTSKNVKICTSILFSLFIKVMNFDTLIHSLLSLDSLSYASIHHTVKNLQKIAHSHSNVKTVLVYCLAY